MANRTPLNVREKQQLRMLNPHLFTPPPTPEKKQILYVENKNVKHLEKEFKILTSAVKALTKELRCPICLDKMKG